jgi:hypothetical protein
VILAGALFYVTVTFSFLLVYDTSKKSGIPPPKNEGLEVTPHPIPITGDTPSMHDDVLPVLGGGIIVPCRALKIGGEISIG